MTLTSSEAAKLLRRLNDDHSSLLQLESQSREFLASVGENPEDVRPDYDFSAVQQQLKTLEQQIRTVKHAISIFNLTHTVPGFDMTVDQLLIYIPQLTARRNKLREMKNRLPKERQPAFRGSSIIDYSYANYDLKEAAQEYDRAADLLSRAQAALDQVNSTETLELELS